MVFLGDARGASAVASVGFGVRRSEEAQIR